MNEAKEKENMMAKCNITMIMISLDKIDSDKETIKFTAATYNKVHQKQLFEWLDMTDIDAATGKA